MKRSLFSTFLTLAVLTILTFGQVCAEEDVKSVRAFFPVSRSRESRGTGEVVSATNQDAKNSTRRELAALYSETRSIAPRNYENFGIRDRTCVKYSVTSTGENVTVVLMSGFEFNAWFDGNFNFPLRSDQYSPGSMCPESYSCIKEMNGLNPSYQYDVVVYNDYDTRPGGGATAVANIQMNECDALNCPTGLFTCSAFCLQKTYTNAKYESSTCQCEQGTNNWVTPSCTKPPPPPSPPSASPRPPPSLASPPPASPPPSSPIGSGDCKCTCCNGNGCTPATVGYFDARGYSPNCSANECRAVFSSQCPASEASGQVSATFTPHSAAPASRSRFLSLIACLATYLLL